MEVLFLTQHFGIFIWIYLIENVLFHINWMKFWNFGSITLLFTLNRYLRIFNKKLGINSIFENATSKYLDKYSVPSYRIKKQNWFQFKNKHTYQVDGWYILCKHIGEEKNSNSKYLNYTYLSFYF